MLPSETQNETFGCTVLSDRGFFSFRLKVENKTNFNEGEREGRRGGRKKKGFVVVVAAV